MKRKISSHCALLLFVLGSFVYVFYRYTASIPQNLVTPIATPKELVCSTIIDSINDSTHITTLQSGLIKRINVSVGQKIKKGEPLFSLYDTDGQHGVKVSKIILQQAENNYIIQLKNLKHAKVQLKRLKSIDKRAISQGELREKTHELKMAVIQLKQLKHNLESARENLKTTERALNQYTTRAPKDGIVLQINAHVDEFVGVGTHIILMGDAQKVIARVPIEERDIKKFSPKAAAFLESDGLKIPLTFIQLDSYIIHDNRLNARVQEALYFFNREDYPGLAAGRQLDAHIVVKNS